MYNLGNSKPITTSTLPPPKSTSVKGKCIERFHLNIRIDMQALARSLRLRPWQTLYGNKRGSSSPEQFTTIWMHTDRASLAWPKPSSSGEALPPLYVLLRGRSYQTCLQSHPNTFALQTSTMFEETPALQAYVQYQVQSNQVHHSGHCLQDQSVSHAAKTL